MINLGFFVQQLQVRDGGTYFTLTEEGGGGEKGGRGRGEEGGGGLVKKNTRDASLSKGPPSKNFEIYSP